MKFYSFLVTNPFLSELLYEKSKTAGIIESEFAIILLVFLEATGLIIDNGELANKDNSIKTPGVIKLSKEYISNIFEIPFSPCSLSLVAKPKF